MHIMPARWASAMSRSMRLCTRRLFSTLTNVDFDLNRHLELVLKAGEMNLASDGNAQ